MYSIDSHDFPHVFAALFIDLSKAFDTVDHSLISMCLDTIGFDRKSLNWFKNDSTDRFQAMLADGYQSNFFSLLI